MTVGCDDKDVLLAYLYDEATQDERRAVEMHVAGCVACRRELEELRGVRAHMVGWTPPERALGFRIVREEPARIARPWWRVPAWGVGLSAAALVLLAAGAAVMNLEVRYGQDGFAVRTAWRRPPAAETVSSATAPWRADLEALERRLHQEVAAQGPQVQPALAAPRESNAPTGDAALLTRVGALVSASEKRQQRELALRLTQLARDVDQQRRADWARIQQGFGRLEDVTSAGVVQQREMLNYIVRVSQRDQR